MSNLFTVEKSFQKYDQDGKGYLTLHEAKCALIYLTGVKPNYEQTKNMLASIKNAKHLTLDLFTKLYQIHCSNVRYEPERALVGACFDAMDMSSNKYISIDDFNKCAYQVMHCSDGGAMLDNFYEIDSNKDGKVTYKDFNEMMKYPL
jgi:Ca2+-binding EF-hand superfamily protein